MVAKTLLVDRSLSRESRKECELIKLCVDIQKYSDTTDIDWRAVGEVLLSYDLLVGDFTFVVDDADFSTDWGWVPTLDFAIAMRIFGDQLPQTHSELFEFTDSDHTIKFDVLNSGILRIEASYVDAVGYVALEEFRGATADLLERTRATVEAAAPGLLENRHYKRLLGSYW